ncbi:MAG: DUF2937 family protein [Sedimenticola sp.]
MRFLLNYSTKMPIQPSWLYNDTMILRYLRLILFLPGVLLGTQIPAVIDGYANRVDAHLIEARENFRGFQQIADHHFSGDVEALLRHHESSLDPIFREEAGSIRHIYLRIQKLSAISDALGKSWSSQLTQLVKARERLILEETLTSHSYTLPLKVETLLFGLASGLLLLSAAETVIRALYYLGWRRRVRSGTGKKLSKPHSSST